MNEHLQHTHIPMSVAFPGMEWSEADDMLVHFTAAKFGQFFFVDELKSFSYPNWTVMPDLSADQRQDIEDAINLKLAKIGDKA